MLIMLILPLLQRDDILFYLRALIYEWLQYPFLEMEMIDKGNFKYCLERLDSAPGEGAPCLVCIILALAGFSSLTAWRREKL